MRAGQRSQRAFDVFVGSIAEQDCLNSVIDRYGKDFGHAWDLFQGTDPTIVSVASVRRHLTGLNRWAPAAVSGNPIGDVHQKEKHEGRELKADDSRRWKQ